ncbi:MAG: carboxypeptidase-like regulatory domain-containing protein, partial [Saprospiraceae bacterium]
MKLKYSNSKLLPFLILVAVFLSSCFKDKEIFEPYPENPWSNLPKTELNVNGEVVDEKGIAIQDVLITAANVSAFTDKNGVFVVKNSLQSIDFIYVKAEKKGYFNGARVIRGNKNGQNIVKIILMEQKKVASISSSKGAEINVQGLKIKFPANGYVDANGKSYSGNINVAAKYLDPSDIQTLLKMPGDLRAVDFQGKEKFLESFGMAAVELTDPTGNKLNLGNGGEAELSFPQPKLATAPAKMPLWHFDEKIGAWREEGEANLSNNRYVGKVKHFSYWNCDFPYDRVFAKGRIIDQNGNSLAGVFVGLDLVGSWMGGHGQTDANGVFLGCIPKGKELELKVRGIADSCSTVLLVKNVGSFNSDVD